MIQLADLVLYAMARGGYYPDYGPCRELHERAVSSMCTSSATRSLGEVSSTAALKRLLIPAEGGSHSANPGAEAQYGHNARAKF
jgi:hypothetical protein